MSAGKKKRSTKKFAKYIVETVCMLAEKGFVWFANKDINESKLAEYELTDEIELDLLVTIEGDQQVTVKQFFLSKCQEAEQLSKIDPEEKSDLIESLAEVMLEKGVGPTPTQELMLIGGKILLGQLLGLMKIRSETSSVLDQLRSMKQGYTEYEEQPEPQPQKRQEQKQEPVAETQQQPVAEEEPQPVQAAEQESDLPIIETPVTTIE